MGQYSTLLTISWLRCWGYISSYGILQFRFFNDCFFVRNRPEGKILEPVGVFEALKQHGKYETGQVSDHFNCEIPWFWFLRCSNSNSFHLQLFLHSVFGYRGIVLFPWHARLYDRDVSPAAADRYVVEDLLGLYLIKFFSLCFSSMILFVLCFFSKPDSVGHGSKEVKGKMHTYYQVLIDTRDCPHIVSGIKMHM